MRFGRSRVVDPLARRITACSSMKELTAVLNAQVPSWTPHHVELALTRWASLVSHDESVAGPILALMKNTSDPALMRALWDLAKGRLSVTGVANSVSVSRHDTVELLSEFPAHVAAHVAWESLSALRLGSVDKAFDALMQDMELSRSQLVLVMSCVAHACKEAAPEMTFQEMLSVLAKVHASRTPLQPQPLVALLAPFASPNQRLFEEGVLSTQNAQEIITALHMIADQPEVVAHSDTLRRAGAPGSFLELAQAASVIALPV